MKATPPGPSTATSYHVEPGHDDGWDVVVERDHHVVSSTHCSDWHRVERICAELDRRQHDRESSRQTTH